VAQRRLARRAVAAWLACVVIPIVLAPGFATAQTGEYAIGIGDKLEINVWQRPDLGATVVVDSQGDVTLPLIGAIRAAGVTPARLGEELTRRLSFVDRDVSLVTVSVLEYNSRRVFVMGEVAQPGPYSFPVMPGVWEAIREAGGPTAEAALTRVRIVPPAAAGTPVVIDLERVLATGDFSLLPPLTPGTTILIPKLEATVTEGDVVFVYGHVKAPGAFSIDNARTALHAVLAAGGPLDDADMGDIKIVRPGPVQARVFEVDLHDYTHRGVLFPNVALLPGDTVTVPRSQSFFLWNVANTFARGVGTLLAAILFLNNDENTNTNQPTVITIDAQDQGQAQGQ
jgi:protein involved in polysaccharide export with SLBB domain